MNLRAKTPLFEESLSSSQIPFLASIYLQPGISQDEISSEHFIDKAATARNLTKLEKAGFIYRKINPENRRKKQVFLTQKGTDNEKVFWTILHNSKNRSLEGFSKEESKELTRLLNRAIDNQINFYSQKKNI